MTIQKLYRGRVKGLWHFNVHRMATVNVMHLDPRNHSLGPIAQRLETALEPAIDQAGWNPGSRQVIAQTQLRHHRVDKTGEGDRIHRIDPSYEQIPHFRREAFRQPRVDCLPVEWTNGRIAQPRDSFGMGSKLSLVRMPPKHRVRVGEYLTDDTLGIIQRIPQGQSRSNALAAYQPLLKPQLNAERVKRVDQPIRRKSNRIARQWSYAVAGQVDTDGSVPLAETRKIQQPVITT